MKNRKERIALLIAVLLAAMLLFAGCNRGSGDETLPLSGSDANGSETAEPEDPGLQIFDGEGKSAYLLVRPDLCSEVVRSSAASLFNKLNAICPDISITTDWDRNPVKSDLEILVGQTTREGEDFYLVDRELLGENGYIIKAVNGKIILAGGGDSGTVAAVEKFISMIPEHGEMRIPSDFELICSPEAPFAGISCGGVSLAEYQLVVPAGNELCLSAAEMLRQKVFACAGVMMPKPVEASDAKHQLTVALTDAQTTVFEIRPDGAHLRMSGTTRSGLCRGVRDFFESAAPNAANELDLSAGYTKDYGTVVLYEDFGAKGDGKTDDMQAIVSAHSYANEKGLSVFGREDAEYYLGGGSTIAMIATDVDWSTAHFIFDDTNVQKVNTELFQIPHKNATITLNVSSLKAGQEKLNVKLPSDCLVYVENSKVMQFIRYGSNQNSGSAMRDVLLVHADGTVDPSTPILWNFDTITKITATPIAETTLTVKGGVITTIANAGPSSTPYYYRGIRIYRSNVVFDGLKHYVTGEGATGQPYYGILIFHSGVNCSVRNVLFTGHKTYKGIGSAGTTVSNGTYDITVTNSIGFTAINCKQTNAITDTKYWGVFASNFCKNITFENCAFSRFDAHCGVTNVTLRGCLLGHQGINLIGHGTATIEDCTIYSKTFVNLRSDYGSTWNGDLIIRNCVYIPNNGASADAVIIGGSNTMTHDFGYTCYLPQNIVIDGLDIRTTNTAAPVLFANINKSWTSASYQPTVPMVMPKSVLVRNVTVANGKSLQVSANKVMFAYLTIGELK